MTHKPDAEVVAHARNAARFSVEARQVSWVLLIGTLVWGVWGYVRMPQRKDPDIPIRTILTYCVWPGATADRVEEQVTRRLEEAIARDAHIEKMESVSRTNLAAVYITIDESIKDREKEFDNIKLKLDAIRDLPDGAGPIVFLKDFGDTATLMLTIASPAADVAEADVRAASLRRAIEAARPPSAPPAGRVAIVQVLRDSTERSDVARTFAALGRRASADGILSDIKPIEASAFFGLDAATGDDDERVRSYVQTIVAQSRKSEEDHPDAWPIVVVRDPATAAAQLRSAAADKYSYRELDDYTDLIARTLRELPIVGKVERAGMVDEQVTLEYSQERLASYGVSTAGLGRVLAARNISLTGGIVDVGGRNVTVNPSGEFRSAREIEDVLVPTAAGHPVYLRDLVDVKRGYTSPPRFLNFYGRTDADGVWRRTRAITLSVQMKAGGQIATFGGSVDHALDGLRARLPADLLLARTSDQPRQVTDIVGLFMRSLEEAIVLVVIVSLIGFWEWRSALLMAASIPLTLALTFGMMWALGIDLQQVSIASLIIALGLLVDDPVVAGDAIKRELAAGHPRAIAAWLGPTKLATAILFATVTNIVAYLPYLLLPGDTGVFLYSLPIVITCSLVASRVVTMTFIPFLGYYLLRPKAEPSMAERRQSGFAAVYYSVGRWAIAHRWMCLAASIGVLALGGVFAARLKTQFFPQDDQYLSYINVWLPEDASLAATRATTNDVERVVRRVAGDGVLKSLTSFVGGSAPRFWFSVIPEAPQLNYAQILVEVRDRHETARIVGPLQDAVSREVPGAIVDVRRIETGPPIGTPVAVRISGDDIETLRQYGRRARDILESVPTAVRARDNWGVEGFAVELQTDADRANVSGVTNLDVAASSVTALNGMPIGTLRDGDKRIPIVARMRAAERAQFGDLRNLYVNALEGPERVPLASVSRVVYGSRNEQIRRRNQFRTITVAAFPAAGFLPSEVLAAAKPKIAELAASLPPGYRLEIGGEEEEQSRGVADQAAVMGLSVFAIFLALVVQFRHAIKPFIVFATIPFGIVGAFVALWIMDEPFGFMAFLGIASLVGVIVSHIIVLFDFIEEARERGEDFIDALLDAGIVRLRPVLITVAATVIALVPLAVNGGPLWKPMCYVQIGGLIFATAGTLLLVPVIYATAVLDLKLVKWTSVAGVALAILAGGASTARAQTPAPPPSPAPQASPWQAPTRMEQYRFDLLTGALLAPLAAGYDQIVLEPEVWPRDGVSYGKRLGSEGARLGIEATSTNAIALLLREPVGYMPCPCTGAGRRFGWALASGVTSPLPGGGRRVAVGKLVGPYIGAFGQAVWTPSVESRAGWTALNGTLSLGVNTLLDVLLEALR